MYNASLNLAELCLKYNSRIPRYTSYPTALELDQVKENIDIQQIYRESLSSSSTFSVYVHLPFCPKLCYFCACNKVITKEYQQVKDYLLSLWQEFQLSSPLLRDQSKVVQIHLGGGSPSYLEHTELEILEELFRQSFRISGDCQKSIEVDPRSFSARKAKLLIKQGYQRFSLGVQDFDPKVQKLINRLQPYSLTADTIKELRSSVNSKINLDLIYGLPGQGLASFEDTLAKIISLKPERIALYAYAHVAWKVKVQNVFNKYGLPSPDLRLQLFSLAIERLTEAGYQYIGLDHFALPEDELSIAAKEGRLKRNFMGYTTVEGSSQLAYGVSAISDLNNYLLQNSTDLTGYKNKVANKKLPVAKMLQRSSEDKLRAVIIESLMCQRELIFQDLIKSFPESLVMRVIELAIPKLQEFIADGLVLLDQDKIVILEPGYFFLRNIVAVFDSYLADGQGQFSQAV